MAQEVEIRRRNEGSLDMTYPTKADCEMERTPAALKSWVDSILKNLKTTAQKNDMRLKKDLAKPFHEEIVPLSCLVSHKFGRKRGVTVKPVIGNQPYDAVIRLPGRTIKVEIANAIDGYDDSLRMEYLALHGHVCMSGDASRTGTKASGGIVQVTNEARNHEEYRSKLLERIEKTIKRKLRNRYEPGTLLAVVFEDYLPFDKKKDGTAMESIFSHQVLAAVMAKFSGLVLLGQSGRFFKEYGHTGH